MTDRLRPLWDFDDLDETERRFQDLLAGEQDPAARAELLTLLGRVQGLRGNFEAGERLLVEAEALAGPSERAAARIDLERGRLRRSGGDAEGALPLFESAFEKASASGELYLAADAAHMAAIAAPTREVRLAWTARGIALAQSGDDSARYWLGPLLNNLGWDQLDAGELGAALGTFRRALAERERDPENRGAIEIARYAVARALRALGRSEEAVPLLEEAVAWAESTGSPDGWFYEELSGAYAALGRTGDAREQARLALPLLLHADPAFESDETRAARLRKLAGA